MPDKLPRYQLIIMCRRNAEMSSRMDTMNEALNQEPEKKDILFPKDFIMVLIGQIISLFGNAILRSVLPLYLLNQTGSALLFGLISACSFLPMVFLFPIGGIIADRVNKRNVMVILDFTTAFITVLLMLLLGKMDIIVLLLTSLILYYGIQGAYQPAVQASIPVLIAPSHIMQANACINLVSSVAGLIGPVAGGTLYAFFGIKPILLISAICFLASAIMEIFIHIPYTKEKKEGSVFLVAFHDMKESFHYLHHDQPCIWKVSVLIALINLLISSLIVIGLPLIVTEYLGFEPVQAKMLYGYAEGSIAAGSLIGGLLAGVLGSKLKAKNSPVILTLCTLTVVPIGLSLHFMITPMISYLIILLSCLIMMVLASMFSIQMLSYLQILTPNHLVGKVISCAMCIGICAQPIGQALYGIVFNLFQSQHYLPFYFAAICTALISIFSRSIYQNMDQILQEKALH